MRCSAVLAVLSLGAAASAYAQPKREETTERVSLDDRKVANSAPVRQAGDWIELASETPARHGQEHIVVGRSAGSFRKLRLDASKGTVVVLRVKVYFDDGTSKTYPVDQRLRATGRKSTVVDLKTARPIDRLVVTTETYTRGAYALFGTSGTVAGR